MNDLTEHLQRLYFLPSQAAAEGAEGAPPDIALVSPAGMVRTLVIEFRNAADWGHVAALSNAMQSELDLPAPAVSIIAGGGYQLWCSLEAPVPLAQAAGCLEGLRQRYLKGIPAARLALHPDPAAPAATATLCGVPAFHAATGRWSAFIDPTLGSMFSDEPGLDMAPNPAGQADLLARFQSIKPDAFRRACAILVPPAATEGTAVSAANAPDTDAVAGLPQSTLGSHYRDPKSFLLAVMNDPAASIEQRIHAATALLPYFEKADPL